MEIAVWALHIYAAGMFMLGVQFSCQQTFVALGQTRVSLFLALLRKVILLIPLILLLPRFLSDQVFAVFLAEPVADILAATTTGAIFFWRLPAFSKSGPGAGAQAHLTPKGRSLRERPLLWLQAQQLQNANLQRPGQVDQLIVRHHPLPGLHPADGLLGQPQPVQLEPDCELLLAQPRPVCRSSSSAPRLSQR